MVMGGECMDIIGDLKQTGIVAIVRGTKTEEITKIAEALYVGGIRAIEVTCNTTDYAAMLDKLLDEWQDRMIIGAGTVTNSQIAKEVIALGVKFVLTPNVDKEVIARLKDSNITVIAGAMTPTEIITANRAGVDMIKLFPAGALGAAYLKQVQGPIKQVRWMPVGGITTGNIADFMAAGAEAFGVGSEIVSTGLVQDKRYDQISARARSFIEAYRKHRAS